MSFSSSSLTHRSSGKTPELYYAKIPSSSSYSFGSFGAFTTDRSRRVQPGVEFSSMKQNISAGEEKITMQNLNQRLASYLETVRILEQKNSELELQIREVLESRGPKIHDYGQYETLLKQLRKEILDLTLGNAHFAVEIDNNAMAADDFKTKFEHELQMRLSVESDLQQLKKLLDNTNVVRLHLENDVESLKEELITLEKNHRQDVSELHEQMAQSEVQVDVDAPKGQDLAWVMQEMRAKYEKMALENQQKLKDWHESKITEVEVQVSENTAALKEAHTEESKIRKTLQTLEIEVQSQNSLKASMEAALQEINLRYNMQMEHHNAIILQRETQLSELRQTIQQQSQDYAALLNMKIKLEAEIHTYRTLLDGGEVRHQDILKEEKKLEFMSVTRQVLGEQVEIFSTEPEDTDI